MAKKKARSTKSTGGKPAKRKTAGKGKASAKKKAAKPATRSADAKRAAKKKPAAKRRTTASKRSAAKRKPAAKTKPAAKKSITRTTRTRRRRHEPQYEVEPQVRNSRITRRQMESIERALMAERDRLVNEMARLQRSEYEQMTSGQSHRFANHQADVASDMSILDTMLIQSGIEADRLRQVQDAIERLEAAQLGICERCGANIGYERMVAKPFARYCIVCREHLERRQRSTRVL